MINTSKTIKVVPQDFETASTELEGLKNSLNDYKAALESSYSSMKANWRGNAANAFEEHVPKLMKDYDTLVLKMETIAGDIKKMAAKCRRWTGRVSDDG